MISSGFRRPGRCNALRKPGQLHCLTTCSRSFHLSPTLWNPFCARNSWNLIHLYLSRKLGSSSSIANSPKPKLGMINLDAVTLKKRCPEQLSPKPENRSRRAENRLLPLDAKVDSVESERLSNPQLIRKWCGSWRYNLRLTFGWRMDERKIEIIFRGIGWLCQSGRATRLPTYGKRCDGNEEKES